MDGLYLRASGLRTTSISTFKERARRSSRYGGVLFTGYVIYDTYGILLELTAHAKGHALFPRTRRCNWLWEIRECAPWRLSFFGGVFKKGGVD